MTSSGEVEAVQDSLKRAAAALRDEGIGFALAGGLASWARGGPETDHDVDLIVAPGEAERALAALESAGMRTERPPEGWLYKAYDGDVLIDVIFAPSGLEVTAELLDRAEDLEVLAMRMPVMTLEDLLVTKLAALREHELDYGPLLRMTRALREQIAWPQVRRRAPDNPFVRAFFTLAEGLEIAPAPARP